MKKIIIALLIGSSLFSNNSIAESKYLLDLYMGKSNSWDIHNSQVKDDVRSFKESHGDDKSFTDAGGVSFYFRTTSSTYLGIATHFYQYGIYRNDNENITADLNTIGPSVVYFFYNRPAELFFKANIALAESRFTKEEEGQALKITGTKLGYFASVGTGYRFLIINWLSIGIETNMNYADTTIFKKTSWYDYGAVISIIF